MKKWGLILTLLSCLTGFGQVDQYELPLFTLQSPSNLLSFSRSEIDSLGIELYKGEHLGKLLEQESVLFMKDYGPGQIATPSLRGSNASHTKVFWNDLQLNAPSLGQFDFSILPVHRHTQVRISHGNASLQQGFGGIGGAINIRNEKGKKGENIAAGHQYGSFNQHTSFLNTSWSNDTLSASVSLHRRSAENNFPFENNAIRDDRLFTREHNAFSQYSATLDTRYQMNADHAIKFNFLTSYTQREIPANITALHLKGEDQKDWMNAAILGWEMNKEHIHFQYNAGVVYSELDFQDDRTNIKSETFNTNIQSSFDFRHQINDRSKWQLKGLSQYEMVTSSGYSTNNHRLRTGLLGSYTRTFFSDLEAQVLLRPEMAGHEFYFFLPAAALYYALDCYKPLKLKVSYAENVNFPSLNDLYWHPGGNQDLIQEESYTLEGGFIWKDSVFQKIAVEMETTFYRGETSNWIQWVPTDNIWSAQNLKNVQQQGLELALNTSFYWKGKFSFKGIYTYTESIDFERNEQLIYVPVNQLKYRLSWEYSSWLGALTYLWIDQRAINPENTVYLPAYDLLGLQIQKVIQLKQNHQLNIRTGMNNIFDKSYQSVIWRPMPGRNYSISLMYVY